MLEDRIKEIDREIEKVYQWFCSNYIRDIAIDMHREWKRVAGAYAQSEATIRNLRQRLNEISEPSHTDQG